MLASGGLNSTAFRRSKCTQNKLLEHAFEAVFSHPQIYMLLKTIFSLQIKDGTEEKRQKKGKIKEWKGRGKGQGHLGLHPLGIKMVSLMKAIDHVALPNSH